MRAVKTVSCVAVMLLCALPALAQAVKLKAYEIEALLSGNTVFGQWDGADYVQFFGKEGKTVYAQPDTASLYGKWRVDAERDEFQSIWPDDADWEGWFVMEWDGDFYWVSKSTPPTLFRVEEGNQMVRE
ncbi:hypothetical protein [Roseobacter sp. OBYS 0001]|uniref:hypothetical protein n=1 Tax=Roseobacter sp. OBYS 0001 TaxID=882651 RepID=UPI001BC74ECA|nr:hypothetical protein [Roseobacter sp. OBYS 0001]GIT87792.1 hypothetical protein ROBYS_28080 [Roseobacter sp. OBYS 0001]